MSIDVLVPIIVVVIEGSEDKVSPLRYQEMLRGSSPSLTKHISCAMPPSLIELDPKENGRIFGGSEKGINQKWLKKKKQKKLELVKCASS